MSFRKYEEGNSPKNDSEGGNRMNGMTETRMREIRSRTRQYRKRYETRLFSCLTVCSLFLMAGIGALLSAVQTPGIVSVAEGYGAVLLRNGAGSYVVLGIAAFVIGVAVTVLCIRLKNKSTNCTDRRSESED